MSVRLNVQYPFVECYIWKKNIVANVIMNYTMFMHTPTMTPSSLHPTHGTVSACACVNNNQPAVATDCIQREPSPAIDGAV